jgi:hypothetical protein
VYLALREPSVEEQLAGVEPRTAFGAACDKLGIELVAAHSAQAKGRVERAHGVYQDRFVKELALRGITTLDTANKLLQNGFTEQLNEKFAQEPARPVDLHRAVPEELELADVFCFDEFRTVQNDWTIRHLNRHYQIEEENRPLPKPKDKVLVRTRLDGSVQLLFRDKPVRFHLLTAGELRRRLNTPAEQPAPAQPQRTPTQRPKPGPGHPWRRRLLPQAARGKASP